MCNIRLTAFCSRPLSKRRLGFFPFHAAPVVGCVISSIAADFKLLLRREALPSEASLTRTNTPGCIATVPLRVAEALAALSLQEVFRGVVRFHRDTKAADFSQRTHLTTSGPRGTDTIKCGVSGRGLSAS